MAAQTAVAVLCRVNLRVWVALLLPFQESLTADPGLVDKRVAHWFKNQVGFNEQLMGKYGHNLDDIARMACVCCVREFVHVCGVRARVGIPRDLFLCR